MLATQTMMQLGMPLNRVLRRLREVRQERYQFMRGFFPGATDAEAAEGEQPRLRTIVIGPDAACVGKTLGSFNSGAMGCAGHRGPTQRDARGQSLRRYGACRPATCSCSSARRASSRAPRSACCRAKKARLAGVRPLRRGRLRSERHAHRVGGRVVDASGRGGRRIPGPRRTTRAGTPSRVAVVHLDVELLGELAENCPRSRPGRFPSSPVDLRLVPPFALVAHADGSRRPRSSERSEAIGGVPPVGPAARFAWRTCPQNTPASRRRP